MTDTVLYCPLCLGKLLYEDTALGTCTPEGLQGEEFYCPSCEMLVEPVIGLEFRTAPDSEPVENRPNPGRSRQGGSNAGGSQRGDLSDQGATQWRTDPDDAKLNSWQDKTKAHI